MKVVMGILSVCILMPIWYFLLYQLLKGINASELTWFLFWVYVPLTFILNICKEAIND